MSETPEFKVAKVSYHVPIALIDPEGGLRPLDLDWVEALSALIAVDGQEDPVEIFAKANGRFGMTAGRHRLAALQGLGRETIEAFIDPENRRREVSENLFRSDLAPMDRAAFVVELIQLEKVRAGLEPDANVKSVLATARRADRIGAEADEASVTMTLAFGFAEQVAEKIGLSRKTIYRDLELHRGLRPDVAAAVRGLPVAGNASQLRALARLPEGEQRAVAELLTAGTAKGVTDALATMRQRPVKSPEQKAVSAIRGNWGRLSARQLKALIRDLPMPAGVTVTIDGEVIGGAK
jgi:hypothetical protein